MKKTIALLASVGCLLAFSNANAHQHVVQCRETTVGQCVTPAGVTPYVVETETPCIVECQPCGRFYAGIFGGANWLNIKHANKTHFDKKTGYAGAFSLGYKFGSGIRIEGEVSYRNNKLTSKSKAENQYYESGEFKHHSRRYSWSYMANFLYDFQGCGCYIQNVVPYVGFGLGYSQLHLKEKHHQYDFQKIGKDSKQSGFAYQAIAGIGYNLTDSTTLAVEYRYLKGEKRNKNHAVGLALRQAF